MNVCSVKCLNLFYLETCGRCITMRTWLPDPHVGGRVLCCCAPVEDSTAGRVRFCWVWGMTAGSLASGTAPGQVWGAGACAPCEASQVGSVPLFRETVGPGTPRCPCRNLQSAGAGASAWGAALCMRGAFLFPGSQTSPKRWPACPGAHSPGAVLGFCGAQAHFSSGCGPFFTALWGSSSSSCCEI